MFSGVEYGKCILDNFIQNNLLCTKTLPIDVVILL